MTKLAFATLLLLAALAPARAQYLPTLPYATLGQPAPIPIAPPMITCITLGNVTRCN
jgi:hypothetical protein